jgi:hypothetical protein
MSSYRTTRFVIGLAGLALIVAVVKYQSITSLVEGGPYWATLPSESQRLGTYICAGAIEKNGAIQTRPEPRLLAVWSEFSHSWRRTGPFSCSAIVNKEHAVRGLCDSGLLKLSMKDGWRFEVDRKKQEMALTSSGAIFGGFESDQRGIHEIRLIANSGEVLTWTVRFKQEKTNQALQPTSTVVMPAANP